MADIPEQAQRLAELLAYPREQLDIEVKGWLNLKDGAHQADLAKALIALTNHGGGYVLLGFTEVGGAWIPDSNRPLTLESYSQDTVNGIVAGYAEPGFHCDVHCVEHPTSKQLFPLIVVPSIRATPTRSKRNGPEDAKHKPIHVVINTYYIRRPGPKSEAPQTGQEWDQLIRRCVQASGDELLATIAGFFGTQPGRQRLRPAEGPVPALLPLDGQLPIDQAHPAPSPVGESDSTQLESWINKAEHYRQALLKTPEDREQYECGVWRCAYVVRGATRKLSLKEFLDVLNRVAGHETGWPPWWLPSRPEIAPYPKDEMIECWLKETTFKDPAHADYWLADPKGRMFLVRGYQEDSTDKFLPGTVFDLTLPVWRVAECLLHAKRLAIELGGEQARVDVAFEWGGLKGRTLTAWAEPMRMLFEGRSAKQDSVRTSIVAVAADINPATLPTLVSELTIPLYNIFDFFEPQRSLFVEEIEKMLGRK